MFEYEIMEFYEELEVFIEYIKKKKGLDFY